MPQCSFGVDNTSLVEFGSTNLRWRCLNNDPVVDSGSCKIIDSNNEPLKTVSALSGELSTFPGETTTYTLTCVNIDGTISIPQTVNILKPILKETKP